MKCIAKKCEDCRLYMSWDMSNVEGIRKQVKRCVFRVLAEEIPRLRGSIDGLQSAANESRNRSMEARDAVRDFANKASKTLEVISSVRLIK